MPTKETGPLRTISHTLVRPLSIAQAASLNLRPSQITHGCASAVRESQMMMAMKWQLFAGTFVPDAGDQPDFINGVTNGSQAPQ